MKPRFRDVDKGFIELHRAVFGVSRASIHVNLILLTVSSFRRVFEFSLLKQKHQKIESFSVKMFQIWETVEKKQIADFWIPNF